MADFTIKEGDTAPPLHVTFVDLNGNPVNLTDASVQVVIRPRSGGVLLVSAPAQIVGDPFDGEVEYAWQDGDTDTPGAYDAEWPTTWANGTEQTFPTEGYTSIEVTADLESPLVTVPPLPDLCWPVDEGCCADLASYSVSVQERAKAMAGQTLRMLTGYRVGGCSMTARPCRSGCEGYAGTSFDGGWFRPMLYAGTWVNVACGCGGSPCGCMPLSQIELPGPIGRVDSVMIGGQVLPESAYRVDDGRWLVRLDGQSWPNCQNMAQPPDGPDAFAVTYLRGIPVDGIGAYAAGVLACEYAKACTTGKCRLPAGVTSIARQGITMEVGTGAFPDGMTGIREVDAYIERYNPFHLKAPVQVWTPEAPLVRTPTWVATP